MPERPWWQAAFGASYTQVYAHRDDAAAAAEVAAVLPRLRAAGLPVLDACCGNGRHLACLRAAGITALGFDYSSELLRQACARPGLGGRLCRSDLRHLPFAAATFGGIALFFTAFGYFDDATNLAVLQDLARLLAPGGVLLLDLPEAEGLLRGVLPADSQRRLADGSQLEERRRLRGNRIEKEVVVQSPDGPRSAYTESVRLYRRDELAALAAAAGLQLQEIWRSLLGPDANDGRSVVWLQRRGEGAQGDQGEQGEQGEQGGQPREGGAAL